jgi:hypothetical protein
MCLGWIVHVRGRNEDRDREGFVMCRVLRHYFSEKSINGNAAEEKCIYGTSHIRIRFRIHIAYVERAMLHFLTLRHVI